MTIPKYHFSRHPLYANKNAKRAFEKILQGFFDKKDRVFEEWRLTDYWRTLLERCNSKG